MKTQKLIHRSTSKIMNIKSDSKKTLINSLSPNFFYFNKFGGIVHPIQICLY